MLTDQQKEEIDSLSFEELSEQLLMQYSSKYNGEQRNYLLARYGRIENERDANKHNELLNIQKKRINIAEEANKLSKIAIWLAVLAFIISTFGLINDFKSSNSSNKSLNQIGAKDAPPG